MAYKIGILNYTASLFIIFYTALCTLTFPSYQSFRSAQVQIQVGKTNGYA
jgi:hypothetical protein